MHDPALPRRHGPEPVGLACPAHMLRRHPRSQLQLIDPHRPEILAVEPDLLVLIALQMQDLRRQQLKRTQQLATPLQQQCRIRPRKLHQNFRMFPLAILRDRRIYGDPVLQFEAAVRDYGLQEFPNLFCSSNLVCDRHK